MSASDPLQHSAHNVLIDALFNTPPRPINTDLSVRTQIIAEDAIWQPTKIAGLSLCILEYFNGDTPSMSALARVDPNQAGVTIPAEQLEVLVQHGIIADDNCEYCHPYYLRQPSFQLGDSKTFTLHAGSQNSASDEHSLEFYIATGQVAQADNEQRCINLAEHSLWLPGPTEHTQVMPLHMHNGSTAMLVRWLDAVSFQPKLDPAGEEVLVIDGMLNDKHGYYSQGSWIRNPIESWQTWAGNPGTLIFYKSGHFDASNNDSTDATPDTEDHDSNLIDTKIKNSST